MRCVMLFSRPACPLYFCFYTSLLRRDAGGGDPPGFHWIDYAPILQIVCVAFVLATPDHSQTLADSLDWEAPYDCLEPDSKFCWFGDLHRCSIASEPTNGTVASGHDSGGQCTRGTRNRGESNRCCHRHSHGALHTCTRHFDRYADRAT